MVLSSQSIRKLADRAEHPMVTPFSERKQAHGLSFGLGPAGYDFRIAESVTLRPGDFLKVSTVERFEIPDNIQGEMKDKSTWARRGLSIFNTVFDPGFRGFATVELKNNGLYTLEIEAGTGIGQMVFHLLDEATEHPYNGKFQDQPRGPQ
jgi:dCTP deaminase